MRSQGTLREAVPELTEAYFESIVPDYRFTKGELEFATAVMHLATRGVAPTVPRVRRALWQADNNFTSNESYIRRHILLSLGWEKVKGRWKPGYAARNAVPRY